MSRFTTPDGSGYRDSTLIQQKEIRAAALAAAARTFQNRKAEITPDHGIDSRILECARTFEIYIEEGRIPSDR